MKSKTPAPSKQKKVELFRRSNAGFYVLAAIFGGAGFLLLAGAVHMSLTGDTSAYETRITSQGPRRNEYGPGFLYLMGGLMLAMSGLLLRPKKKKKPR